MAQRGGARECQHSRKLTGRAERNSRAYVHTYVPTRSGSCRNDQDGYFILDALHIARESNPASVVLAVVLFVLRITQDLGRYVSFRERANARPYFEEEKTGMRRRCGRMRIPPSRERPHRDGACVVYCRDICTVYIPERKSNSPGGINVRHVSVIHPVDSRRRRFFSGVGCAREEMHARLSCH